MRTFGYLALVLATVVGVSACAPAHADTSADEATIKSATVAWLTAYNAGNVDTIVAMYADDAVVMPPHAPVANGAAAIRAFLTKDTAESKAAGLTLHPESATASVVGDVGWESGSYTVADASGTAVDSGSYLGVSRKINGKWLLIRDTWNSDRPMPPAATAATAPAASK